MRNPNSIHTHQQWVQTLTTGGQTDGLFRLSPALARRLIPGELLERRRDLGHCRRRQAELAHAVAHLSRAGRETLEQGTLRRQLGRQQEQAARLRAEIALLVEALHSLSAGGRFLPPSRAVVTPPRPQPRAEREWSRETS